MKIHKQLFIQLSQLFPSFHETEEHGIIKPKSIILDTFHFIPLSIALHANIRYS